MNFLHKMGGFGTRPTFKSYVSLNQLFKLNFTIKLQGKFSGSHKFVSLVAKYMGDRLWLKQNVLHRHSSGIYGTLSGFFYPC